MEARMVRIAYSVSEVAEMLGKSKSTIWKYLAEGHLTRHKLGGSTLIPAEEVDALGRRNTDQHHDPKQLDLFLKEGEIP